MPVDFTKDNKKTNVEYLRDLLTKEYEEQLEFLEAIKDELEKKDEKIFELEGDLEVANEKDDDEESEFENSEDIMLGVRENLKWSCDNISVYGMMEVLVEKVREKGAVFVETILRTI